MTWSSVYINFWHTKPVVIITKAVVTVNIGSASHLDQAAGRHHCSGTLRTLVCSIPLACCEVRLRTRSLSPSRRAAVEHHNPDLLLQTPRYSANRPWHTQQGEDSGGGAYVRYLATGISLYRQCMCIDLGLPLFTSVKEVMFSSLSVFVSLFACLLVTLRKSFQTDLHEIFREGWQSANEQMIEFWWRTGSPSGYRDRYPYSSLLGHTESG